MYFRELVGARWQILISTFVWEMQVFRSKSSIRCVTVAGSWIQATLIGWVPLSSTNYVEQPIPDSDGTAGRVPLKKTLDASTEGKTARPEVDIPLNQTHLDSSQSIPQEGVPQHTEPHSYRPITEDQAQETVSTVTKTRSELLLWSIVAFFLGLLLGLVVWLGTRARTQRESEKLKIRLAEISTKHQADFEKLGQLERTHSDTQQEKQRLEIQLAEVQKEQEADAEKLQWIEKAQAHMREAFEAIAGQTLQTNAHEFLERAREQVDSLLKVVRGDWKTHKAELQNLIDPLNVNMTALDSHVRELEQKREGAYQSLQQQLSDLATTHARLQTTTITLPQALKSPTVRGRWGEMQLRRVVEMAGMVKHVSFMEQVSTDGGRPDLVVNLPNSGVLPVDSKVPLESYLEAMEVDDEDVRKEKIGSHTKAMQSRVRELGQKKYWEQFERAPDFVVMFVPIEACLGAAFESDPNLLEYAINQRILITTPITLLALLRAVACGWQQHQIAENARKIAEQGQEIYKRLATFVEHLVGLGKNLSKTVEEYNRTIGSLERRLLPAARRFEQMGVAVSELDAPGTIETQAVLPSMVENESSGATDGKA